MKFISEMSKSSIKQLLSHENHTILRGVFVKVRKISNNLQWEIVSIIIGAITNAYYIVYC